MLNNAVFKEITLVPALLSKQIEILDKDVYFKI